MSEKIIIYGTGNLSEILVKLLEDKSLYEIAAFTVDSEYRESDQFMGFPLIDFESIVELYPPDDFSMIAAIGYKKMRNREALFTKAKHAGYTLKNYIGPKVIHYSDFEIGENNLIFDGTFLGPYGKMGDNNIIRPMCYIGHGFNIGSHNFISAGMILGGVCKVENSCFLGMGSRVIDHMKVSNETLLAAGSVLTKPSEAYSMYAGSPAQLKKRHEKTGIVF